MTSSTSAATRASTTTASGTVATSTAVTSTQGTSVTTALASLTTTSASITSTPSIPALPTIPYTYNGCYEDNNMFDMALYYFKEENMTPELCAQWVSAKPWLVTKIGLRNGNLCYYGYQLPGVPQVPSQKCRIPCPGDSSQVCGGEIDLLTQIQAISVYTIPTTKTPSAFPPSVFTGCISYPSKLFTQDVMFKVSTSDHMTPQLCVQDLVSAEYTNNLWGEYTSYGLLNGNECWVQFWPYTFTPGQGCGVPCAGNSSLTCGGSSVFDLYTFICDPKDYRCN
ncbi:hypothetical protein HDU98_010360 [Podochytrium sp. JEL0797]|nr:hypothetical protein HDU98_010360 [Podochytrium sp. JEL0797]